MTSQRLLLRALPALLLALALAGAQVAAQATAWQSAGSLPGGPRSHATLVVLEPSGGLLLLGGYRDISQLNATAATDLIRPPSASGSAVEGTDYEFLADQHLTRDGTDWAQTDLVPAAAGGPLWSARANSAAVSVGAGAYTVLLYGGVGSNGLVGDTWLLSHASEPMVWSQQPVAGGALWPGPRAGHGLARVYVSGGSSAQLVLIGGVTSGPGGALDPVPSADVWVTAPMNFTAWRLAYNGASTFGARWGHGVAVYDNLPYLMGGFTGSAASPVARNDVWRATTSAATAWVQVTATAGWSPRAYAGLLPFVQPTAERVRNSVGSTDPAFAFGGITNPRAFAVADNAAVSAWGYSYVPLATWPTAAALEVSNAPYVAGVFGAANVYACGYLYAVGGYWGHAATQNGVYQSAQIRRAAVSQLQVSGIPYPPPCGAGSYGCSGCTLCPPGAVAPNANSISCTRCPAGTYSATYGGVECTVCPAGQFAATTGSSACSLCRAGTYQPDFGATSCRVCPSATHAGSDTCPDDAENFPAAAIGRSAWQNVGALGTTTAAYNYVASTVSHSVAVVLPDLTRAGRPPYALMVLGGIKSSSSGPHNFYDSQSPGADAGVNVGIPRYVSGSYVNGAYVTDQLVGSYWLSRDGLTWSVPQFPYDDYSSAEMASVAAAAACVGAATGKVHVYGGVSWSGPCAVHWTAYFGRSQFDTNDYPPRIHWSAVTGGYTGSSYVARCDPTSSSYRPGPCARAGHAMVALPVAAGATSDRLLVVAGATTYTSAAADVWRSEDTGASWVLVTASAPFGTRVGHAMALVDGLPYLMGGFATGRVAMNDVWRATDAACAVWQLVTAAAPWSARAYFGSAPTLAQVTASGLHPYDATVVVGGIRDAQPNGATAPVLLQNGSLALTLHNTSVAADNSVPLVPFSAGGWSAAADVAVDVGTGEVGVQGAATAYFCGDFFAIGGIVQFPGRIYGFSNAVRRAAVHDLLGGTGVATQGAGRTCDAGYAGCGGVCTLCPAGTFSAPGSASCTPCASGYVSSASGSVQCTACPANTYSSVTSTGAPGAGVYFDSTTTGAQYCLPCPPYSGNTGASATCWDRRGLGGACDGLGNGDPADMGVQWCRSRGYGEWLPPELVAWLWAAGALLLVILIGVTYCCVTRRVCCFKNCKPDAPRGAGLAAQQPPANVVVVRADDAHYGAPLSAAAAKSARRSSHSRSGSSSSAAAVAASDGLGMVLAYPQLPEVELSAAAQPVVVVLPDGAK